MRVVLFCHSLVSDWNHGNAHFLRGIVTELQSRGVEVRVFEPVNAWSVVNLLGDAGEIALHVGAEHRYAVVGKALRHALKGDGLASAGGAGDQPMAVRHPEQNVFRPDATAEIDAGTRRLVGCDR